MRSLVILWVACGAGAAAAGEPCPSLAAARKAYAKIDYTATARAIDECLAFEGLSREVLLEMYEMQGIVAASRRQNDVAREAFKKLFALDPNHSSSEVSPRIATPYYEAQSQVAADGALSLSRASADADGSRVTLALAVSGNKLGLGETVRLHARADGGAWQTFNAPASAARFTVTGARVEWWAELLGKKSAQLLLLGSEAAAQLEQPALPEPPPVPAPVVSAEAPASSGSSLRPLSVALAGVGVVSLGVGAVFGVLAQRSRAQFDAAPIGAGGLVMGLTRADALALESQAKLQATLANVLMIGGGVLAVAGVALFVVDLQRAPVALLVTGSGFAIAGAWP